MGRRKKGAPPAYLHDTTHNLAYCSIAGRKRYLGAYGSPESRAAYRREMRDWEQTHEPRPLPKPGCTVAELCLAHSEYAARRYVREDGSSTSEVVALRLARKSLLAVCARMEVNEVSAAEVEAIKAEVGKARLSPLVRRHRLARVVRVFRWGVGKGL